MFVGEEKYIKWESLFQIKQFKCFVSNDSGSPHIVYPNYVCHVFNWRRFASEWFNKSLFQLALVNKQRVIKFFNVVIK